MRRFIYFSLGALMFFCSCGYQFEGGGYLRGNARKVSVRIFDNKTSQTGVGLLFTNALVQEIAEKTDTKIVDDADAKEVIEGVIRSITFSTLSRTSAESVLERNITAVIDLRLLDPDNDVIWSLKGFTIDEAYRVSGSEASEHADKRRAVEKIAKRSAEKIVSKMLMNF